MIGKILWKSERDGNGILVSENKEWYFDKSVCKDFDNLVKQATVSFEHNDKIKDCPCAKNIEVLDV